MQKFPVQALVCHRGPPTCGFPASDTHTHTHTLTYGTSLDSGERHLGIVYMHVDVCTCSCVCLLVSGSDRPLLGWKKPAAWEV